MQTSLFTERAAFHFQLLIQVTFLSFQDTDKFSADAKPSEDEVNSKNKNVKPCFVCFFNYTHLMS